MSLIKIRTSLAILRVYPFLVCARLRVLPRLAPEAAEAPRNHVIVVEVLADLLHRGQLVPIVFLDDFCVQGGGSPLGRQFHGAKI